MKIDQASNSFWVDREKIRQQILEEAVNIVTGERQEQYGKPEDNFATIADMWNAYIERSRQSKKALWHLNARNVADMMILMKVARLAAGGTRDSYVDVAGYAACGGEILEKEKEGNLTISHSINPCIVSRSLSVTGGTKPVGVARRERHEEELKEMLRKLKGFGLKLNEEGEKFIAETGESYETSACLWDRGL